MLRNSLIFVVLCFSFFEPYVFQQQSETLHHRSRRLVSNQSWQRWPGGIILYCHDKNLASFKLPVYSAAMSVYEKRTCLSFRYYRDCSDLQFGIRLKNGGWGYSRFGRTFRVKDTILGNTYKMIMHELGHVIGAYHEQMNYKSIALAPYLYGNLQNWVLKEYIPVISEKNHVIDKDYITFYFDLDSLLLYSRYGYSANGFPTFDVMYPDVYHPNRPIFIDELVKEIQTFYNCWDLKSCGSHKPNCDNEGYAGYTNHSCGCVCPAGLDPASNCRDVKKQPTGVWPDTNMKLLQTTAGCPFGFTESSVALQGVSHFTISEYYSLQTIFSYSTLTLKFCNKPNASKITKWNPGMIGFVAENHQCPSEMQNGTIIFNGEVVLMFCVQQGLVTEPVTGIPTDHEFALFALSNSCQEIDGFIGEQEYFTLKHSHITVRGDIPRHSQDGDNLQLVYCVYKPLNYDCGRVINLNINNPITFITSPNYPDAYPSNTECNWVIKVEENSRIKLEFEDFDIRYNDNFDYRRYILNALPTRIHMSDMLPRNIVSIYNRLAIRLKSGTVRSRGGRFKIKVMRLGAEDYCYSVSDKGESYDGDWNYAIDGTKCLPWNLRFDNNFTLTGFSDFDGTVNTFLTGSACRNPQGRLHAPACLTFAQEGTYHLRYCDVCHIEYGISDIYENCVVAVSHDSLVCKGPTAGKCLETCINFGYIPEINTPPPVDNIVCPVPLIPSNAMQTAATIRSVYHPGHVVELMCDSGKSVNISCTTSGQWSEWNDPCSGCPAGWAEYSGNCYKVTGRVDNWYKANTYCRNYYGATLVSLKTNAEHDFFLDWRAKLGSTKPWWIGAFYYKYWKWFDDKSSVSSLETATSFGYPRTTRHRKTCMVHNTGLKFNSETCVKRYNFMCKKPLQGEPMKCTDRKEECSTLLNENPRACLDPVIKTNVCPYTCGADVCSLSSNHCPLRQLPANAATTENKTSLGVGEIVELTCDPGYKLQSGSLVRACTRNGALSGSEPVCTSLSHVITPVNTFRMGRYRFTTSQFNLTVYTGESKQLLIPRDGQIHSWQIYCTCDEEVQLQVWRPASAMIYTLIGSNTVQCFSGLIRNVTVDVSQRISVRTGDRLGLFDIAGNCFSYYPCKSRNVPDFSNIHYFLANSKDEIRPSSRKTFYGSICRMFAINAGVGQ